MSKLTRLSSLLLLVPLVLAGCSQEAEQSPEPVAEPAPAAPEAPQMATTGAVVVDQERLELGTEDPTQWIHYGGSYDEQRFSHLDAINTENISELGLAFYADYDTNQNQHGSPLYVDGVIYVSTAKNVVHAFDARDGSRVWTYTPIVLPNPNLGLVNRGLGAYNGKIYQGMLDASLVAIDANTGEEVWRVNTVPQSLDLPDIPQANGSAIDMESQYSITMAPRVAKGKVFVGGSGGEFGVRGWIAAYDAETGEEIWRFWTVPGSPERGFEGDHLEMARETWPEDIPFWEQGGGGTIWDATVYDPVTDLLYFGTGNGTPWNREMRDPEKSGDNLFVASVIAVDPDTGEYVWHYQETPGDSWDYDAVSPMMTADLVIDGVERHVIIHPSKNGMIYVLDAATGEFISGDEFTAVTWAVGFDENGRPIEAEGARYIDEPYNIGPGAPGGHTWHPNAFSPETGLIYIPTWENYSAMVPQEMPEDGPPSLIAFGGSYDPETIKPHNLQANDGWLQAWDPVAREVVWETPRGGRATSGVLATGGNLVFMGNSNGNQLNAYNAETGEQVWSFDAQTAVYAAPITYELDGEQYIAASVGGSSSGDYFAPSYGRMLVFRIGGTATLPPALSYTPPEINPPPSLASAEVIEHGQELYNDNCGVCHGNNGVQRGSSFPNLSLSALLHSQEGFDLVVLDGIRREKGMAGYSDTLSADDSVAIREYLIARANEISNAPGGGFGGPPPPAPEEDDDDVHEQAAQD